MNFDTDIAKVLGVSAKAMRNHAKELGLTKGERFQEYYRRVHSARVSVSLKGKTNSGQFQKGNKPKSVFQKGPVPREIIEKRAATLRRRYYEDRLRIKYGLEPKMKYHLKIKYYIDGCKGDNVTDGVGE